MTEIPRNASIAIVGGGVMGVSTAYHLAKRGQRDVVLLERAELFGQGATGKCAGGVRHQFATEINVRLSIESIRMLERFEEEVGHAIGLNRCGYMFVLSRESDVEAFRTSVAMQRRLGVMTDWLSGDDVRRRVPVLEADDAIAGTFCARDALADPSGVVDGYVQAARRLGATLLTDVEVVGATVEDGRVRALSTTHGEIAVESVVNAAGPFAADVGRFLGVNLPIWPLRRQIAVTSAVPGLPADFPMLIDFATGLYFHREGEGVLTGMSNRDEPPGPNEEVDLEWEQVHLAKAVERLPLLENAGLAHHWAGLYEMSPDAHPLIGRVEPLRNAYVVAGFSGHGFMHGPIAGKLLSEIILDGAPSTLDISSLDPSRFDTAGGQREYAVV